jgi:redox-sensitive bicupin YhaK (pirin superfamily)
MGDITTVPLGMHWPTVDPFLFCAHHRDEYPAGTDQLTPRASLVGRNIGSDFSGTDGWSMYHGTTVPGFPQHPHRGFETVSFLRRGVMDHADSLGATARFGAGDVQWMTAGAGIVHSEMFPLLERGGANPVELFQIWINLPAEDKMVPPHFKMLWSSDVPKLRSVDDAGRSAEVTIVAGELGGSIPPSPPPHSWAARPDTDVAIWHVELEPEARWVLSPAARTDAVRSLYVYDRGSIRFGETEIALGTAATVPSDRAVTVTASAAGALCLILQGRPIVEPIARYGPFVMNDRAGIEQALVDYQETRFGGWPWPTDDPNHGPERRRFARHADGRIETASGPGQRG